MKLPTPEDTENEPSGCFVLHLDIHVHKGLAGSVVNLNVLSALLKPLGLLTLLPSLKNEAHKTNNNNNPAADFVSCK